MKELYDEIVRCNSDRILAEDLNFRHDLNIFFSRLLFCYFAEDTDLFEPKQFTNSVKNYTKMDGSDLPYFFEQLFESLDSKPYEKQGMVDPFNKFPYVNGTIFDTKKHTILIPKFNAQARHLLIQLAESDWSDVNPDIFGTIFQGIVDAQKRDENGMDYTSVTNIEKVINPLFMDELWAEYDKAKDSINKLNKLWSRISQIKIFDPACGSGNFLIITYKRLRELEQEIIRTIDEISPAGIGVRLDSQIKLDHFFGIELEDFPRELAILSMFIAAHQMNIKFEEEFGKKLTIIPIIDMPSIIKENSTRIDWNSVCPNVSKRKSFSKNHIQASLLRNFSHGEENGKDEFDEIYIIGNPPYKGAKKQTPEQKRDFKEFFSGVKYNKNLDYISIWFIKGARYIKGTRAKLAFVSTNSIVQGEQIENMWPYVFENNVEIFCAYTSFKWSNSASNMAAVTCVIVSLQDKDNPYRTRKKFLYSNESIIEAKNINAYLANGADVIVSARRTPLCTGIPAMVYGNMPLDGNALKLTKEEKEEILEQGEKYSKYIRPMIGGRGMVEHQERWCLWIEDQDLSDAAQNPIIARRIEDCKKFRLEGGDVARTLVNRAHQFRYRKVAKNNMILTPCTTTANRDYIPSIIVDASYITDNSVQVIFDSDPWIFSIVSSIMHMTWVKAVCGRLQDNYRYSAMLGYNTFPIPSLNQLQKQELNDSALDILMARENHTEMTLAQMYDPDKMPEDLCEAHHKNDLLVDKLYQQKAFLNDEERLAILFAMYEDMTKDKKK